MHAYRYKLTQSNKKIDGCQVLKEVSTDKKQLLPKIQLCNMAELRKRTRNSQCCATLWQGNLHKVAAPYFCFMYIVQLYKEDWGILRTLGCRAVDLPNTEQIVQKYLKTKLLVKILTN